ncbi:keratin-associated protein 12-2-like [Cervus elaphus]|uniref:keratin-associated protein 12-2-like n=1 Tax=Cervus elaphus TaxID=9860 RepID=UPI001CC27853|nr:keratin-associated protein 12-2-like [Cervus elaphus]
MSLPSWCLARVVPALELNGQGQVFVKKLWPPGGLMPVSVPQSCSMSLSIPQSCSMSLSIPQSCSMPVSVPQSYSMSLSIPQSYQCLCPYSESQPPPGCQPSTTSK